MNNINKILIAVELDKLSEVIIEYGITLGIMFDATVSCIHVSRPKANRIIYNAAGEIMDDFSDSLDENNHYPTIEEVEELDLENLRAMILSVKERMEIKSHLINATVRSNFAVKGILEEAEDIGADLVVVGAHVDYRSKELGVTNLARQVVSQSLNPVVVVPTTYGNRNLDHLCMFINFDFDELEMMQDLIEMSLQNEMHLTFVHVLADEELEFEAVEKLNIYKRLFINNEDHSSISFRLERGDVSAIVDNLIYDLDVDLICLKKKKKHWNLLGFQKSFDTRVMEHLKLPLLFWKE